jgi:hypothetical protein
MPFYVSVPGRARVVLGRIFDGASSARPTGGTPGARSADPWTGSALPVPAFIMVAEHPADLST